MVVYFWGVFLGCIRINLALENHMAIFLGETGTVEMLIPMWDTEQPPYWDDHLQEAKKLFHEIDTSAAIWKEAQNDKEPLESTWLAALLTMVC